MNEEQWSAHVQMMQMLMAYAIGGNMEKAQWVSTIALHDMFWKYHLELCPTWLNTLARMIKDEDSGSGNYYG